MWKPQSQPRSTGRRLNAAIGQQDIPVENASAVHGWPGRLEEEGRRRPAHQQGGRIEGLLHVIFGWGGEASGNTVGEENQLLALGLRSDRTNNPALYFRWLY